MALEPLELLAQKEEPFCLPPLVRVKLTVQAETWKPLESHTYDLVTFPFTCKLAVPELVERLGECVSQQTVILGKLWTTAFPQSWRFLCQGGLDKDYSSVVPMFLGN